MYLSITRRMMIGLITGFAFLFVVTAAQAATFIVNTTADTQDVTAGDGLCADAGGSCSLRAAITEANAFAGADIITLPAGTYTETLVAASENANAGGDYDITSDISINGAGSGTTIIQANAVAGVATERVFHIRAAVASTALTVVLDGITIQNGRNAVNAFGGGIRIDQSTNSNVTISNSTVTNNLNDSSGGGLSISTAVTPTVTITNSTFSNNRAGSAVAGTSGTGGGIQVNVAAIVNISGTNITGNIATTGLTTVGPSGGGISIAAGTTTINNSTISNNTASLTVAGSANSSFSGGVHLTGGTANITGTTISGNSSTATNGTGSGFAGGIYNQQSTLNLTNSTVTGNTASSFHAGIRALAQTILTTTNITNSTISNNSAPGEGGGVINFAVGAANSVITLNGSTISGNMSSAGTSVGGGVENVSTSTGLAVVNLSNSTVSGNSANDGAGVWNSGAASTINLDFSTVASNTAATQGGGLSQTATGVINLKNSIVAYNAATTGPDIFGTITSQNYNHVQNTAGGTFLLAPNLESKTRGARTATLLANDVTGTDPLIGPLASNGGPTFTRLPSGASPVKDTIPNGTNGCGNVVTADQRGISRPQNGSCDKGSVEISTTAALVYVSGRVTNTEGRGITNVKVTVTGNSLAAPIFAVTGRSGAYTLPDLESGQTYVVTVGARRFTFSNPSRVISLVDNVTDADFVAEQ